MMELEESRKSLLKEKQELTEKVSSLQLLINNLESTITYSLPNMNNIVVTCDYSNLTPLERNHVSHLGVIIVVFVLS